MAECELSLKDCDGEATQALDDGDEKVASCDSCARRWADREPTDDQIMNGPGVEGGIGYREEDTLAFREQLKDAGRR